MGLSDRRKCTHHYYYLRLRVLFFVFFLSGQKKDFLFQVYGCHVGEQMTHLSSGRAKHSLHSSPYHTQKPTTTNEGARTPFGFESLKIFRELEVSRKPTKD